MPHAVSYQPMPVRGSAFTPVRFGGGASDAIGRMGNLVDVMAHYAPDLAFLPPNYRNYHCPDIDFLTLFGITEGRPSGGQASFAHVQDTTLSALIADLIAGTFHAADNTLYRVRPDVYYGRERVDPGLATLVKRDGLVMGFLDRLRYTPGASPFSDAPDVVCATLHLRRKDICGLVLFDAGRPNPLDVKIADRPLLQVDAAMAQLEDHLPAGSRVELVIASDGTDWLYETYRDYPDIVERIDGIAHDLQADPVSTRLDITLRDRMIGAGRAVTLRTMDAMYHSDVVVTQSSSFARLPCQAGGTTMLRNDTAARARSSECVT